MVSACTDAGLTRSPEGEGGGPWSSAPAGTTPRPPQNTQIRICTTSAQWVAGHLAGCWLVSPCSARPHSWAPGPAAACVTPTHPSRVREQWGVVEREAGAVQLLGPPPDTARQANYHHLHLHHHQQQHAALVAQSTSPVGSGGSLAGAMRQRRATTTSATDMPQALPPHHLGAAGSVAGAAEAESGAEADGLDGPQRSSAPQLGRPRPVQPLLPAAAAAPAAASAARGDQGDHAASGCAAQQLQLQLLQGRQAWAPLPLAAGRAVPVFGLPPLPTNAWLLLYRDRKVLPCRTVPYRIAPYRVWHDAARVAGMQHMWEKLAADWYHLKPADAHSSSAGVCRTAW